MMRQLPLVNAAAARDEDTEIVGHVEVDVDTDAEVRARRAGWLAIHGKETRAFG